MEEKCYNVHTFWKNPVKKGNMDSSVKKKKKKKKRLQ